MKKYTASFADVKVGKAATFGFQEKSFGSLRAFARQALRRAWVPVTLNDGKRDYDHITQIHNWMRFDCDMPGEKQTISSLLQTEGIAHICSPSTNYNPKTKNHKWHISVPTTRAAQDPMQYKGQIKEAMNRLGISLHDTRVSEVCVQNMNPYRNGLRVSKGKQLLEIHEGSRFKLPKPDKNLKYNPMQKTIFNGKGTDGLINKKVEWATETLEVLSPESGIRLGDVGWIHLKDLNLEPGGIIGNLSCPGHNHKHQGGATQVGYAFASMDEGGDVWIKCTGAECRGKSYKMEQRNFGAYTKLSDLYELRRFVSMSAYDFNSNSILHVNDDGSHARLRWVKENGLFIDDSFFWGVDMTLTEATQKRVDKQLKKDIDFLENSFDMDENEAAKKLGEKLEMNEINALKRVHLSYKRAWAAYSLKDVVSTEILAIQAENELLVIKEALNNEGAFNTFKKRYYDEGEGYKDYIEEVKHNIFDELKSNRQFETFEYRVDPYAKEIRGEVINNVFTVTVNNNGDAQRIAESINWRYVEDYKEHNPYLDDIINMMMLLRFGADKRSSFLWLQCPSSWGKSFLFDGIFGDHAYTITMDELKLASKGNPSGLDPAAIVRSSMLFTDEFKSAITELKLATHTISVTPKGRGKYVVPVFLKVFASVEPVRSLVSEDGAIEAQYAERFLKIEAMDGGRLLDRKLYKDNKAEYFKAVKLYVHSRIYDIQNRFQVLGATEGSRIADKEYAKYVKKYSIKKLTTSLDDSLPDRFQEWVNGVMLENNYHDSLSYIFHKGALAFKKNEVYILNLGKAVELFADEAIDKSSRGMVLHKNRVTVVGEKRLKKTSISSDGIRINALKLTIYGQVVSQKSR